MYKLQEETLSLCMKGHYEPNSRIPAGAELLNGKPHPIHRGLPIEPVTLGGTATPSPSISSFPPE